MSFRGEMNKDQSNDTDATKKNNRLSGIDVIVLRFFFLLYFSPFNGFHYTDHSTAAVRTEHLSN